MARALANRPRLLLADEPTGSLDPGSKAGVLELLREVWRGWGVTVLVVSHDPLVGRYASRSLRLVDGRVVEGPPS